MVVQPSGGCPGRVRQNSTDNPLALRDRCHFDRRPARLVRGNVLVDAAREDMALAMQQKKEDQTFSKKSSSDSSALSCPKPMLEHPHGKTAQKFRLFTNLYEPRPDRELIGPSPLTKVNKTALLSVKLFTKTRIRCLNMESRADSIWH